MQSVFWASCNIGTDGRLDTEYSLAINNASVYIYIALLDRTMISLVATTIRGPLIEKKFRCVTYFNRDILLLPSHNQSRNVQYQPALARSPPPIKKNKHRPYQLFLVPTPVIGRYVFFPPLRVAYINTELTAIVK